LAVQLGAESDVQTVQYGVLSCALRVLVVGSVFIHERGKVQWFINTVTELFIHWHTGQSHNWSRSHDIQKTKDTQSSRSDIITLSIICRPS